MAQAQDLDGLEATALDVDDVRDALLGQVHGPEGGVPDQHQLRARYIDAARELAALDEVAEAGAGPIGEAREPTLQAEVVRQRREGLQEAVQAAAAALETAGFAVPEVRSAAGAQKPPAAKGQRAKPKKASQAELVDDDVFAEAAEAPAAASAGLVETERDRLIRLGVLTPFDALRGFERRVTTPATANSSAPDAQRHESIARMAAKVAGIRASQHTSRLVDAGELPQPERAPMRIEESFWRQGDSDYIKPLPRRRKRPRLRRLSRSEGSEDSSGEDLAGEHDDADPALFRARQAALARHRGARSATGVAEPELELPSPAVDSDEGEHSTAWVEFEGGFRIQADLYNRLFPYQQTGVKWLWELHTHRSGGILGDEMGLGKTVQIGAFLSGLVTSGLYRPSLVVCPATVLRQWLRELRAWAPALRVGIWHDLARRGQDAEGLLAELATDPQGLLLTTYEHMRLQRGVLLGVEWGYVILDEGHRIRNPDAEVTLTAKQMPTVHRLILTGAPIQNRLTELWSLFDFVYPGKLGTLPVFQAQFGLPIQTGGYANATALQVATAYKCAVVLRDMVGPYLLRRRKADVAISLPSKTEQVLFCVLTPVQRDLYKSFLASRTLRDIFAGHRAALAGIDILRKICNHPDLLERAKAEGDKDYGSPERSGKLTVLKQVLQHWHTQGHKALVFTQTQQMLDIVEKMVENSGYRYHRMDGTTPVAQRATLMDDFNHNPDVFIFLLTTRVGGLGVNLTGANRIVVFDPDWNFSTDIQARERAWRIGQTRDVVIYRFVTSGTIEEKIYHRQVYKQFLSDKVLRDPRQRRFFKSRDMQDLFTLGDGTETAAIFGNSEIFLDDQPAAAADIWGDAGTTDLLRALFEGAGLHSAVDHAAIEHANDPETMERDREAMRVARAAAAALRASRASLAAAPISQPTWTGRSGGPRFGRVGANGASRGGSGSSAALQPGTVRPGQAAPHSSLLLARMRARAQGVSAPVEAAEAAGTPSGSAVSLATPAERLASEVVAFLESVGGSAPSNAVVEHFQPQLPESQLAVFRGVLKSVATLKKVGTGKLWMLKREFGGQG